MSKEKQIEEMARTLCGEKERSCEKCDSHDMCEFWIEASVLHNAGYRKQKEGEWKKLYDKAPRYVCTICNHLFNNKEYKYCPNCGARMSGGQNE